MPNQSIKEKIAAAKVLEKILTSKGQVLKASWRSEPTPAAKFKKEGIVLEKRTVGIVQAGVEFQNLSAVKEAIEAGERGEVQPLPWGTWSVYPYIIEHKGEEFIRLYPSPLQNHIPKSIFYVNGEEVTKEKFSEYLQPAEAKKLLNGAEEKPLCFTVKANNILGLPEDLIEG